MPYRVRISRHVQQDLDDLPRAVYNRVAEANQGLSTVPRPIGVKKLKGFADTYRVRVGDYRIVYEVDDTAQEVRLKIIADRKDAYR